jgi:hypothetical protein
MIDPTVLIDLAATVLERIATAAERRARKARRARVRILAANDTIMGLVTKDAARVNSGWARLIALAEEE